MEVHLFATIEELKHRLKFPTNELDFIRIINLISPRDWEFAFTFSHECLILNIQTHGLYDPSILIKGAIASILDCQTITVQAGRHSWQSNQPLKSGQPDSNILKLTDLGPVDSDVVRLEIHGFNKNKLPQVLAARGELKNFLSRNTWMGSGALHKQRYKTKIQVLNTLQEFENQSEIDEEIATAASRSVPTLVIESILGSPPIGKATYKTYAERKGATFRWTNSGEIKAVDKRAWLSLDSGGWPEGEFEIAMPYSSIAPDGSFSLEGDVLRLPAALEEFANSIRSSKKFIIFREQCINYEKEQSARRIDKRKRELLNVDFVFYGKKYVYRVPSNESELVSLHQKLEGMGALPFATFASLEYTAKLGIDAIVHYKISPMEGVHQFATVEFEFVYENFFLHGHPIEQTNLIICWERLGSASAPSPVIDSNLPWLSRLTIADHVIRVVEVSKYPGLKVKNIREIEI